MEQLIVEFPERKPTKEELAKDIIQIISATLDVLFFDGKKWITYTASHEIPMCKSLKDVVDIPNTKAALKRQLWRWFVETMKAGEIEINGEMVKIYGVAAEPIYEELEV